MGGTARLSPLKRTHQLTDDEVERLFKAAQQTLNVWVERLREQLAVGRQVPRELAGMSPWRPPWAWLHQLSRGRGTANEVPATAHD